MSSSLWKRGDPWKHVLVLLLLLLLGLLFIWVEANWRVIASRYNILLLCSIAGSKTRGIFTCLGFTCLSHFVVFRCLHAKMRQSGSYCRGIFLLPIFWGSIIFLILVTLRLLLLLLVPLRHERLVIFQFCIGIFDVIICRYQWKPLRNVLLTVTFHGRILLLLWNECQSKATLLHWLVLFVSHICGRFVLSVDHVVGAVCCNQFFLCACGSLLLMNGIVG